MADLTVELYGCKMGRIMSAEARTFDFEASDDALKRFGLLSTILSFSIPLTLRRNRAHAKRRRNYFEELLPEGRMRSYLAHQAQVEEHNIFKLLEAYGLDVAGALLIYPEGTPLVEQEGFAKPVDSTQVRELLEMNATLPLANNPLTGKTSLAGMQMKILLAKIDDTWNQVHKGYPSTHILKPVSREYPTLIYDEAFAMQLAQRIGLTNHPVWIENFDGHDALVIERYDRQDNLEGNRIHQEDFNQVLGAHGDQKYQEIGGKVTLQRIAKTLSDAADYTDVISLARQLIFAIAIGNVDMHAKNISVLHLPDATCRLAPAYDMVPLRHQKNDGRVALSIGGEYVHSILTRDHIVAELLSWKSAAVPDDKTALSIVEDTLLQIQSSLPCVPLHQSAYAKLPADIARFTENLLEGKRVEV